MTLTDKCNQEVLAHFGPTGLNILQYYTPYNQMMDLKALVDSVLPLNSQDCIDKANGKPNVCTVGILAESVGTYNTNIYLQLPGARADVVALSGAIPPDQWSLENNAYGLSLVMQDNFRLCVTYSNKCKQYLGEMAHVPQVITSLKILI
jgi:hypothetical protein